MSSPINVIKNKWKIKRQKNRVFLDLLNCTLLEDLDKYNILYEI